MSDLLVVDVGFGDHMRLVGTLSHLVLVVSLLAMGGAAAAADRAAPSRRVATPQFLYHWTSWDSLHKLDRATAADGALPLKTIDAGMDVTSYFPELAERPGLYAWTHPVGGIGASYQEVNGNGEALVQLEIAAGARAVLVTSEGGWDSLDSEGRRLANLESIDLLLHRVRKGGVIVMQEWIVLNPNVIVDYTADPVRLRPLLEPEVAKLRDERFNYGVRDIYYPGEADIHISWVNVARAAIIRYIETFLGSAAKVPKSFRSSASSACGRIARSHAASP